MLRHKIHWRGGFWFVSARFLHSTEAFFYRMDANLFSLIFTQFTSFSLLHLHWAEFPVVQEPVDSDMGGRFLFTF